MSSTQPQLLPLLLIACLGLSQCSADLSFIFGDTSLFNVQFKTPAWLGRQIPLGSNIRIETDVDPNIQEDSHLSTVSTQSELGGNSLGKLLRISCNFKFSEFFVLK